MSNLLQSQGKTKVIMKLSLLNIAIGIPLGLVLIPNLGVIGLIATNIVMGVPSMFIGLWLVNRYYNTKINWPSSIRTYSASGIAAFLTYLILTHLPAQSWIQLMIGGATFTATYLIIMPLIGTINKKDTQNMRQIISEFGFLTKPFNRIIDILEKLIIT